MKSKKKRNLILLLVVLLGITIGFAYLSTTLYINGTSTIKGNTWNIYWDGNSIQESQGSVTATTPASLVSGKTDEIQFAAKFDLPGDYYEFTVDAVNAGTIDGMLKQFTPAIYTADGQTLLKPEDQGYPDYLIFTVTYDDNTAPTVDSDILAKRTDATHFTTQKYKVRVEFDKNATSLPTFPQNAESVDFMFKLDVKYQQYKAPAQNNNQP